MADVFDKRKRSEIMRRIRSVDTGPEMRVRKKLHELGYRYRLHDSKLPGKPDMVMRKHNAIIQIRGCFWHHHNCSAGRIPSSNTAYWEGKLKRNRSRDEHNDAALQLMGWSVFIVWECEVRTERALTQTVDALRNELPAPTLKSSGFNRINDSELASDGSAKGKQTPAR